MPPQKSIIVNSDDVLLGIHRTVEGIKAAIDAELVKLGDKHSPDSGFTFHCDWYFRRAELQEARREADLLRYDLTAFSGRSDLSESEKQIWRRTIRQLEAEQLVEIYGNCWCFNCRYFWGQLMWGDFFGIAHESNSYSDRELVCSG